MIVNRFCKISKNIYNDTIIYMHNSREFTKTKAERTAIALPLVRFMNLERKLSIRESIG